MRTVAVLVLLAPLVALWAIAWAIPPHRNCRRCGTDHRSRADRFDQDARDFAATWNEEDEEPVSRHWVQAHQTTGQPARAWCSTCPWEWAAQPGQDLADADAAMQEHRRNTEAGRTGR